MFLVLLFEVAIYFLYFFHLFLLGGGSPFSLIYFFLLLIFFLILFFIWLIGSNNQFRNDEFEFSWFFDQLENKSTLFNCHFLLSKKESDWLSNSWNFILYSFKIGCWMIWWAGCLFIFYFGIFVYVLVFWHFCRPRRGSPRRTRTQWPFCFAFRQNTGGRTYLPMWFVRIFA